MKQFKVLSAAQMKSVKGGICQWRHKDGSVHYADSQHIQELRESGYLQNWCCDSCGDASWAR